MKTKGKGLIKAAVIICAAYATVVTAEYAIISYLFR